MKKIAVFLLVLTILAVGGYAWYYGLPWKVEAPRDLTALSSRVDQLEKDCESVTRWYFNYNKKVEAVSKEVSLWDEKIDGFSDVSDDVKKKLNGVNKSISEVRRNLFKLKGRLEKEVEFQGKASAERISKLKQEVKNVAAGVSGKTEKLSKEVKAALGALAVVKNNVAGMTNDLEKLKSHLGSLRKQTEEVMRQMENFKKKSD